MITEKTARNRENAVAQAIKPEVEKINRGLQYLECLLQNHNEALQNYQQRVANRDAIEREIYVPDAIIIDAVVDSVRDRYKGLRELLSKVRPKDIPVYLYTDVTVDLLQEDLHEEEFRYIIDGRYFQRAEEGAIERLVRNLRNTSYPGRKKDRLSYLR